MTCLPRIAALLILGASAAGCAAAPPSRAGAAAQAACRSRADEAFLQQDRAAIYQADNYDANLRDSPYGTAGLPGITTRGLADDFSRDRTMQSCLQGIGTPPATDVEIGPGPEAPIK